MFLHAAPLRSGAGVGAAHTALFAEAFSCGPESIMSSPERLCRMMISETSDMSRRKIGRIRRDSLGFGSRPCGVETGPTSRDALGRADGRRGFLRIIGRERSRGGCESGEKKQRFFHGAVRIGINPNAGRGARPMYEEDKIKGRNGDALFRIFFVPLPCF